jgi:hypothetical protein
MSAAPDQKLRSFYATAASLGEDVGGDVRSCQLLETQGAVAEMMDQKTMSNGPVVHHCRRGQAAFGSQIALVVALELGQLRGITNRLRTGYDPLTLQIRNAPQVGRRLTSLQPSSSPQLLQEPIDDVLAELLFLQPPTQFDDPQKLRSHRRRRVGLLDQRGRKRIEIRVQRVAL